LTRANVSLGIKGVNQTSVAFRGARNEIRQTKRAVSGMSGMMMSNRRVIQQAGMQMSDFAVQVGGGQSAILALTQNLPQFVQGFGAVGGVMAALITIAGTLALVITKTGTSLNDLTPIAGVVEQELQAVVRAMVWIKETAIDMANLAVNNLDRLFITASLVAGVFAGKWVAGMIEARVATHGLAGAVTALTKTLLVLVRRVLIVALFVAIGEVIFRIVQLTKQLGGIGPVMRLVGEVFVFELDRWKRAASLAGELIGDMWLPVQASLIKAVATMRHHWAQFLRDISSGLYKVPFMEEVAGDVAFAAGMMGQSVGEMRRDANSLKDTFKALAASIGMDIASVMTEVNTPLAELRDALIAADEAGSNIDIRDWFGGGDDPDGPDALEKRLKSIEEMVEDLATTISQTIGDALMSVMEGTKTLGEAFRDMARAIIKELFDVLVVKQLVAGIGTMLGGGVGSGGGFLGGLLGAKALGGPVAAGQPYMVGERGPEVFVPGRSGTVVPNGAGGGTVVNQYFSFSANGDESVKRIIAQAAPKIAQMTEQQIIKSRRRGGTLKATFG